MNLKSRIVKSELVELKNLKWFQSESLKNISDDSFKRLKKSIYENGFIQHFVSGKRINDTLYKLFRKDLDSYLFPYAKQEFAKRIVK